MPARKNTKKKPEPEALTFEDALLKLEGIVDSMESEQLPLEDLVSQYESGSELLKYCDSVLSAAKKRIELITLVNNEEKNSITPTSPTASDVKSEDPDDNDISLF